MNDFQLFEERIRICTYTSDRCVYLNLPLKTEI